MLDIPCTGLAGADTVEAEPLRLHSLPQKTAQTVSVDSDAEAVQRLLQCPLTKVSIMNRR